MRNHWLLLDQGFITLKPSQCGNSSTQSNYEGLWQKQEKPTRSFSDPDSKYHITNVCQIANQLIHMLHHTAGQNNNIQNNNTIGSGGSGGGNTGATPTPPGNATLNPTPRTVNQLWDEFMVGIGG